MMEDSDIVAFVENMDEYKFQHNDAIPVQDLLELLGPDGPDETESPSSTIPSHAPAPATIPTLSKEGIGNAISSAKTLILARILAVTTILQKNEFDQKTGPVIRMYLQDLQQFISIIDIMAKHIQH